MITLIGITEPMEVYEYTYLPSLERQIRYMDSPVIGCKIMYPVMKPSAGVSSMFDSFDNYLTATYESHELKKLLYYEE